MKARFNLQFKLFESFLSPNGFFSFNSKILFQMNWIGFRFEKKRFTIYRILSSSLSPHSKGRPNQKLYFLYYLHSLMKLYPIEWKTPTKKIEMSNIPHFDGTGSTMTRPSSVAIAETQMSIFLGKLPFSLNNRECQ